MTVRERLDLVLRLHGELRDGAAVEFRREYAALCALISGTGTASSGEPGETQESPKPPRNDRLSRQRGINEARAAFERMCELKPRRCIPASPHDDDMVLLDVLAEWEQLRWDQLPNRAPAQSARAEGSGPSSPAEKENQP